MYINKIKVKAKDKGSEEVTQLKIKINVKGYRDEISDFIKDIYNAIYGKDK
jgi:maltose-binding protein MalE